MTTKRTKKKVARKAASKIADKMVAQRKQLWPEIDNSLLWDSDFCNGWTIIPRTFPLIQRIMDELANGKPVSNVYLDLWCRVFEAKQSFLKLAGHHDEMAYYCGYSGQRAVQTWKSRVRILNDLGFINVKSSAGSDIGHALILNPHLVIKNLRENDPNSFSERLYNAIFERALDIGADDFTEE